MKTSTKGTEHAQHYSVEDIGVHEESGLDELLFHGPGLGRPVVRVWNAADRNEVLRALEDAFAAGVYKAQLDMREAIGLRS